MLGGFRANADEWVEKGKIPYKKTRTKGGGGGVEINEKNTYVILERLVWIKNIPQLTKRSE